MELRQLHTFATAAEHESFTRAAEQLDVTQPAVSHQVASLEHELRVSLFERRGRRIRLTDAGHHLYRYARRALDLLERASREIGETSEALTGGVQIASCTIPPESFLPEVLAAFRRLYPEIRESVSVTDTAEVTRAVESRAADVGFVVVPPQGSRLRTKEIACVELMLVAAPHHRLVGINVTAEHLLREPFILRKAGSGTRIAVERVLHNIGISPSELTIALETNSNDAVRGAVRQGSGIAFLAPAAAYDDLTHGRLVQLRGDDIHAQVHIYLITDPERIPKRAVRAFLEFVQ